MASQRRSSQAGRAASEGIAELAIRADLEGNPASAAAAEATLKGRGSAGTWEAAVAFTQEPVMASEDGPVTLTFDAAPRIARSALLASPLWAAPPPPGARDSSLEGFPVGARGSGLSTASSNSSTCVHEERPECERGEARV